MEKAVSESVVVPTFKEQLRSAAKGKREARKQKERERIEKEDAILGEPPFTPGSAALTDLFEQLEPIMMEQCEHRSLIIERGKILKLSGYMHPELVHWNRSDEQAEGVTWHTLDRYHVKCCQQIVAALEARYSDMRLSYKEQKRITIKW